MLRAAPVVDKQSEKAHGKAFKARLNHAMLVDPSYCHF